jgi:hypothetical protein
MAVNYVLLERIELAASAASVTFSNIPQTGYTDLKVVASLRQDSGTGNYSNGTITINGGGTAVTARELWGNGSGKGSATGIYTIVSNASNTANSFSSAEFYFPNYTSSTNKSFSADLVSEGNFADEAIVLKGFLWSNTAAITSITLNPSSGNFIANSTVSLYGLAAVGTTPTIAPKAAGGSIYTDNTYWYHVFRTTGTFVPQINLTCDALVVAGGGGGGYGIGGGGGAGGYLGFTNQALTALTSYTATVGAGGGAGPNSTTSGISGSNSQFGALTASVGGGGGNTEYGSARTGGSGGGGNWLSGTGAAGTAGQGYAGGSLSFSYSAGGGGGASQVGYDSNASAAGNGGDGLNTHSSWATATSTGVSGYYAGGGGGGQNNSGVGGVNRTGGSGGAGGGGIGGTGKTAGVANTGGGGGGGYSSGNIIGTAGGSGIVIIRYPV